MDLFPAIDLRRGDVVRLRQGKDGRRTTYGVEPVETARSYRRAGCRWLHLVDLDAAFGEEPQRALLAELASSEGVPRLQIGGGFRSEDDLEWAFSAGCERVVLGSLLGRDPDRFAKLAVAFPNRLVAGLDCDGDQVRVAGWQKDARFSLPELCRRVADLPVAAALVTDISRDGMLQGPNLEIAASVAEQASCGALVSGGVSHIDHIVAAAATPGVAGVVVGRALYEGSLEIDEALAAAGQAGRPTEQQQRARS